MDLPDKLHLPRWKRIPKIVAEVIIVGITLRRPVGARTLWALKLTLHLRYFSLCCHSNCIKELCQELAAAGLSRLGSETVESSNSRSSSPFPIESLQDMGDAALLELKEQARYKKDIQ